MISTSMSHTPLDSPRIGRILSGVFTPVLVKPSKSFSLIDCIAVAVEPDQRGCRHPLRTWPTPNSDQCCSLSYLCARSCPSCSRRRSKGSPGISKVVDHSGIVGNYPLGALAQLGLARAYLLNSVPMKEDRHARPEGCTDGTGTAADPFVAAGKAYRAFLTFWKDADPDIPVLRQARAEFNTLVKRESISCRTGEP